MSLYGPTFHDTFTDLRIVLQCQKYIYLVSFVVEVNLYNLYEFINSIFINVIHARHRHPYPYSL